MTIEHRIRAPRIGSLLIAGVYAGFLVLGVAGWRDDTPLASFPRWLGVIAMALPVGYFVWFSFRPVGDVIRIQIGGDDTQISRNAVVVYDGKRLSSKQLVEDGVAFHFYLPEARFTFTLPKSKISDDQIKALREK